MFKKTAIIFCLLSILATQHTQCICGINLQGWMQPDALDKPIPQRDFRRTMNAAANILKERETNQDLWLNKTIANVVKNYSATPGYIQKYTEQTKETFAQTIITLPESEVITIGDLHDDAQSLLATLQRLKLSGYISEQLHILDPNVYFIALGDYTDRGNYGIAVWYLLANFLIANPKQVFLLRGNHEERQINIRYGFDRELKQAHYSTKTQDAVYAFYGLLPVAIFFGSGTSEKTHFVLFNHAGIELGFDPKPLLAFANHQLGCRYQAIETGCTEKERRHAINILKPYISPIDTLSPFVANLIINSTLCGFNWNDFIPGNKFSLRFDEGRGTCMTIPLAKMALEKLYSTNENVVHATIHGHEHNDIPQAKQDGRWCGCNVFDDNGMWPCNALNMTTDATVSYRLDLYPMYMLISSASGYMNEMPGNYSFAIVKTDKDYSGWTIRFGAFEPKAEIMAFKKYSSTELPAQLQITALNSYSNQAQPALITARQHQ